MEALRNQWYCAAFGHELQQAPMARVFLGEPVVMYRQTNGAPVAWRRDQAQADRGVA